MFSENFVMGLPTILFFEMSNIKTQVQELQKKLYFVLPICIIKSIHKKMKKLALVLALFVGVATTSTAQESKKELPRWAQAQDAADKPAVEKAISKTNDMVKSLKLDEKQELIVLEINVGLERTLAKMASYNGADKQDQLNKVEERRVEMFSHYLTPKQLDAYKAQHNLPRD